MKVKRTFRLTAFLLISILMLAACAPRDQAPTQSPSPGTTTTPSPTPEPTQSPGEDETGGPEASTPEGLADGEYTGRSDTDERGGYGIATVTIENEKITEVDYKEYTSDDKEKTTENGYEYEAALKAFEELPDQLIEKQNVDEIDDYSGATGTTNKFRTAVKRALGKASKTGND